MAEEQATTETESTRDIYELGYHVVPTVAADDLASHVTTLKTLIEKVGGSVISEEAPAQISLAYTMEKGRSGTRDKYDKAYFGWIKFEGDIEKLATLKEALDQKEEVLRYLLIKTVREDTRAAKKILAAKPESPQPRPADVPETPVVRKEEKPSKPVSQGELDKAIEELVVD